MDTKRIVMGLGNCVDYELAWDSDAYTALARAHGITARDLDAEGPVRSERDLIVSILSFLRDGRGGERYVASTEVIEAVASHFSKKITLGGTNVRAAIAMHRMGCRNTPLHLVTMNEHVRALLPEGVEAICSQDVDTMYPHLIIQYHKGAEVRVGDGRITSPRENRIIYHNDYDNSRMLLSDKLPAMLEGAEGVLLSGFNAMQDPALLRDCVHTLDGMMDSLPAHALVVFEDAAYRNPALSGLMRETLLKRIGIYSMNEDEWQAYLQRRINLLDAGEVIAALQELHALIPAPILIVHTQYWALAYGQDAGRYAQALLGGVVMAGARMRFGDEFTPEGYRDTEALPARAESEPFVSALLKEGGDSVCCVPSKRIDTRYPTTIGLGDAFVGGFLYKLVARAAV